MKDPIVEEVRSQRTELSKKFNYDVDKICRFLTSQHKKRADLSDKVLPVQPLISKRRKRLRSDTLTQTAN